MYAELTNEQLLDKAAATAGEVEFCEGDLDRLRVERDVALAADGANERRLVSVADMDTIGATARSRPRSRRGRSRCAGRCRIRTSRPPKHSLRPRRLGYR